MKVSSTVLESRGSREGVADFNCRRCKGYAVLGAWDKRPQSWRGNPYFYPPSHGIGEANFFVEATETHRSTK